MFEYISNMFRLRFDYCKLSAIESELAYARIQKNIHVAIIFSNKTSQVLAYSTNKPLKDGSIHAETACISNFFNKIKNRLIERKNIRNGVSLISLRIGRDNTLRMAMPCINCTKRLYECNRWISNVYWLHSDDTQVVKKKVDDINIEELGIKYCKYDKNVRNPRLISKR